MSAYDVNNIIQGYAQGYFLMANQTGTQLSWYSSHHRTLMPLDDRFRYPKSLRRVLNQQRFTVGINQAFDQVVAGCADRRTTWISQDLQRIYRELHRNGWAHSFEAWQGNDLAGGVLGITIGGLFIGESMFYRIPDGSKVALVRLVEHLRSHHYQLFDVQMMNPHLSRFGAYSIDAQTYQTQMQAALQHPCRFA